jgi:hypothetical protein
MNGAKQWREARESHKAQDEMTSKVNWAQVARAATTLLTMLTLQTSMTPTSTSTVPRENIEIFVELHAQNACDINASVTLKNASK